MNQCTLEQFLKRNDRSALDAKGGMFADIVKGIQREADKRRSADWQKGMWPEDAAHPLKHGFNSESKVYKTIVEQSPKIVLDKGEEATVAGYEQRARNALAAYIVVDSMMWIEAVEYVYAVSEGLEKPRVQVRSGDVFLRSAYRDFDNRGWHHLDTFFFGADQREAAAALAGKNPDELPLIEVDMPETMSLDIAALELDRCARKMTENIAKALYETGRNGTFVIPPTKVAEAYRHLKDTLDGYSPFAGVPDELDGLVLRLLAELADIDNPGLYLDRIDPAAVRRHVERFYERTVAFDLGGGMSP
jgi:hypothetical protein